MTLQQLEYIVALDNHRHFVTAAEHCFVTQPTLTMQVQKLEEETGVKIFDRSRKPLVPTAAGEQIIRRARLILEEVSRLKAAVHHETESAEGAFRVGIIPTLAPYLLPLFLPSFIKANPQTHLRIQELQTEQIIARLTSGAIDIGILVTPLEEKKLREIPVFREPFLLYLPPGHSLLKEKEVRATDLDPKELLVLEEGHCFREQALAICRFPRNSKTLGFDYESGSIETLKSLVDGGMGYTLVPELSVEHNTSAKRLRRFAGQQPVREVSIVVGTAFTRERLIELLHDSLQENLPPRFARMGRSKRVKWR